MKTDDSIIPWINLHNIPKISPNCFIKLIEHFETPENILKATEKQLLNIPNISNETVKSILENKNKSIDENYISWLEKNNINILILSDDAYPKNLKSIYSPPPILYVKGELKEIDQISIAIVGSRLATVYGKTIAQKLCEDLIYSGITIVSGMARGIDSIAHEIAMKNGGRTIAVLGCGIDVIYPPENRNLYHEISKQGAVISEFPIGTKPEKYNFPRRNRLISGLSLGCLIIEAGEKSGSLITANCALEEGREVFALPGYISSKQSVGTNNLIKKGEAKLVQTVDDILDELVPIVSSIGKDLQKKNIVKNEISLTVEERKIKEFFNNIDPTHIDKIITFASENKISNIFSILLGLEIKGVIRQIPGKNFINL